MLGVGSVLDFDLGGLTRGESFDYLDANGTARIAGTLQVSFLDGFGSGVGAADTFILLDANSALTGHFFNVANGSRLPTLDGLGSFRVHYGAGSSFGSDRVVLSAFESLPEPGTGVLLAIGVACASRRRV